MFNAYVLLILTTMIYAGNLIVGKFVTNTIPAFNIAFLRLVIALLFLLPLGFREWKNHLELWKREWKAIFGLSLTGIALFNILVYFSLHHTTSINAGIIEGTTPIFSILLGFIFLKETFNNVQIIGVVLSFIGVIWVITKGAMEHLISFSFNLGDITMFLAIIDWAVYSIFVKLYQKRFPLYGSLTLMMLIAVLFSFPFAALEWEQMTHVDWRLSTVLGLLYLGIFPSVLALIFWNKAVSEIGPARSSVFLNLMPVFTTIGAIIFLGESFTVIQGIGGLMVLLGVFLTSQVKIPKNSTSDRYSSKKTVQD